MDLKRKLHQFILNERLVRRGDLLLVGVSGGADSVCLLHVLHSLRSELGIRLHIAHFNHCLRPTALRDELFVKGLADQWGIPITVARRKGILKSKVLSEDEARRMRFDFFYRTQLSCKADLLVLAHTQNDLAETVLMRLLRGAGLSGLRGILADRKIHDCRIIRPLVGSAREDVELYLKRYKLKYCTDETNTQRHYMRNRLRLDLIPLLKKDYNPSISGVLLDLAYNSQADYDYLLMQARRSFKKRAVLKKGKVVFSLKALLSEPVALRRMLLRLSYEHLTVGMDQLGTAHMREAEDLVLNRPSESVVSWPKGVQLHKSSNEIVMKVQ